MIVSSIKPSFKFQNNGITLEQFIKNVQDSVKTMKKSGKKLEDMIIQRVQRGVSNSIT